MIIGSRYLFINGVNLIVITSHFSISCGHYKTNNITLQTVDAIQ